MKIILRPITLRGERKWQLDYEKDGKRRRPSFPSKEVAEHERSRLTGGRVSAKAVWAMLRQSDKDRIILAFQKASEQGHDLASLLERSKELQPHIGPSLADAIIELLRAKENAGRSDRYTTNLKILLNKFSKGRESMKIDALSLPDVEKFLDANNIASRSTLRSRLSTLFKFAVRRGYRLDNPCARLESITIASKPPEVFSVDQFKTAVKWLKASAPHGLSWFALSTVCGLRPEEAEKTTKAEINFDEGFVKVEAQTTKVRRRRVVYPKPEAMRFLRWATEQGSIPIDPQPRKRVIAGHIWKTKGVKKSSPGLRHALKFDKWPKDITRHTAASYWLAGEGETVKHVAKMLGHSESICESRYKAVKTQKEAEEFWKVVEKLSEAK